MAKEMAKSYKPSEFEDKIYDFWLKGNYFHTEADPDKKPYTIVMPPPNITGQLHIGHALDETLQDILIRYKRMSVYAALWVPGTQRALQPDILFQRIRISCRVSSSAWPICS